MQTYRVLGSAFVVTCAAIVYLLAPRAEPQLPIILEPVAAFPVEPAHNAAALTDSAMANIYRAHPMVAAK